MSGSHARLEGREGDPRGEGSSVEEFKRSPPHQSAIGACEERVIVREDPPPEVTVATVVAERQASAGARDGVKGKRNDLAARAPLHALVRRRTRRVH